ncbi:DUF1328 domain-containing protein [Paenibacillus vietnamensis]|uniref:DUF1328 domain-containing protein n=1 Tax=Paenibacillus vietnamensis TaxID=2590547 RepID=UPI0037C833FE
MHKSVTGGVSKGGWTVNYMADHQNKAERKVIPMLGWALLFFIFALVAGIFGFFGIASALAGVAKILFVVFVILFIVSLIMGRRRVS